MSALGWLGVGIGTVVVVLALLVGLLLLLDGDEHHACDCHPRYGVKATGPTVHKGMAMGPGAELLTAARAAKRTGGWGPRSLLNRWVIERDERRFARGYQHGVGLLLSGADAQVVLEHARSSRRAQQFNLGVIMAVGHWVERVGPRPFPRSPVRPEPVELAAREALPA